LGNFFVLAVPRQSGLVLVGAGAREAVRFRKSMYYGAGVRFYKIESGAVIETAAVGQG